MEKTPRQIAEEIVAIAFGEFVVLADELSGILQRKPEHWVRLRPGVKSDTACEREYQRTPDGLREQVIRLRLKVLEKQMSSLRAMLSVRDGESKNLY